MSTQVCWCTQTLCSVSLVKKRNTQLETMKVHICHISKPSWCVYHSQTHRSEKCGQLHTATRLATPRVICTYHKQLQAGCGLQRPDYHPSPSVAPWYTRSLCSTDHRHTCRLDAGHRNAFIPALQHSLVDQVAVQHLPQTHLQATEMRSSQHGNSPRYTRSLFCTYRRYICRPQRCSHPHIAMLPDTPSHCAALTTDISAGWMQATEMRSSPHCNAPWYTSSLDSCIIVLQHTQLRIRWMPWALLFWEACDDGWEMATSHCHKISAIHA